MDTAGAELVPQQAFDFRVIDALDLVRRIEVGDSSRRRDQSEAVAVERELGFTAAGVLDRDLMRIVDAIRARHAGRRFDAIIRRLFGAAFEVKEGGGEGFRGYGDIQRHDRAPSRLGSLGGGVGLSAS